LRAVVLLLATAFLQLEVRAAGIDAAKLFALTPLEREAESLEAAGEWAKASECYARILSEDRDQPALKERYQYCLRRAQLVRRHADSTYLEQIAKLSLDECLQVYVEVLSRLQSFYVEREKVEPVMLFRRGLEELRFALSEKGVRQTQGVHADAETVEDFREQLDSTWKALPIRRMEDARLQVRRLASVAHDVLGLRPGLVVFEMAAGACSGLDEYTYFLTPGQFRELNESWKGEVLGIGVEVVVRDEKVVIAQVVPGSAGDQKGLKAGEQIVRVGNKLTSGMLAEAVAELLKGEADTTVVLEVVAAGQTKSREVELKRQVVHVPSLSEPRFLDDQLAIGYLQLVTFQETTVRELDLAILKLQQAGMRALILDLRGNQGGLFEVAIQVVERFISAGVIVSTHGQVREYNMTYRAHGSSILTVPLVVLIDGETASAAEMVAGALKDHQRGKLVGRTTFGKGSIQRVQGLSAIPAGIRMTVARFYSPRGLAYSETGVSPHLLVDLPDMPVEFEQDAQVHKALEIARALAMSR
jgi:carboxyl-terminal processing protease